MPSHPPELITLAARLKITPDAPATLRAQADARAAADRDAVVRAAFAQHLPAVAPVCTDALTIPAYGLRMLRADLVCVGLDHVTYSAFVRSETSRCVGIGGAA